MQSPWGFFLAFLFVLALIGGAAYLARRFAGNRLGASANRGRMPRLAVIDAAAVDGRRRLVLVRRDNIEHLLMIGGPTDIVVEPNIVRATPARDQAPPPRAVVQSQDSWTENEPLDLEPPVMEAPRAPRTAFPDEPPRRPQPPRPPEQRARPPIERPPMIEPRPIERPSDPFANMIAEQPPMRPEPPMRAEPPMREPALREPPRAPMPPRNDPGMPRSEPLMPRPRQAEPIAPKAPPPVRAPERAAAPPPPPPAAAADQNLAEMAQRLEAALRRPNADADRAPPVAPDAPRSARPSPNDLAAELDQGDTTPKTQFKNLEEEMASLLGRPKTPS